jgi:hypothetical protein
MLTRTKLGDIRPPHALRDIKRCLSGALNGVSNTSTQGNKRRNLAPVGSEFALRKAPGNLDLHRYAEPPPTRETRYRLADHEVGMACLPIMRGPMAGQAMGRPSSEISMSSEAPVVSPKS